MCDVHLTSLTLRNVQHFKQEQAGTFKMYIVPSLLSLGKCIKESEADLTIVLGIHAAFNQGEGTEQFLGYCRDSSSIQANFINYLGIPSWRQYSVGQKHRVLHRGPETITVVYDHPWSVFIGDTASGPQAGS